MPKITSQRTFTACWTCRRRNIRCDNKTPTCSPCTRSSLECEGYDIRLVWVDPKTGLYEREQRRAYPCELTWKGHQTWSLKEIGHLIAYAEDERCQCRIHKRSSPFITFPAGAIPGQETRCTTQVRRNKEPESPATDVSDISTSIVSVEPSYDEIDQLGADFRLPVARSVSVPWVPGGSRQDNELFHHYISHLAGMMTPIDDERNPWKSTYPSLAVCEVTSSSTRSLRHAILSQSAYQLASVKTTESGKYLTAAAKHFGLAVNNLRNSLENPLENFSSTLAAILSITLANHVFFGQTAGLGHHIQGAVQYVAQHLKQKPWLKSHDAWVVTQSFVVHTLMFQLVGGACDISPDADSAFHEVLHDVIANPDFAYTMGSTPRIMKALYQARLLEVQLGAAGSLQQGKLHLYGDTLEQAGRVFAELHAPSDAEIDLYMSRQRLKTTLSEQRKFIASNLSLFNSAVTIYFIRMVLHCPPRTVADLVVQVLSAAVGILKTDHAAVSIWPIVIASAEAYTLEAQDLADSALSLSTGFGIANRSVIHRVVHSIWEERKKMATQQQYELGEVLMDWRQLLKQLDVDILLL